MALPSLVPEQSIVAVATEHSDAPVGGELQSPAARVHQPPEVDTLCVLESPPPSQRIFTLGQAATIRKAGPDKDQIHSQMRETLVQVRGAEMDMEPEVLVRDVPDDTPWREYIATHKEWRAIIGPGITHFSLQFFLDQPDANVFGQLRCDFVAQQCGRVVCRLHPGHTSKSDAHVLYIPTDATELRRDISWYLSVPCHSGPYHMADIEAVPTSARLGKNAAWDIFQKLPQSDRPIDITKQRHPQITAYNLELKPCY